jgi:hypothetical protein
MKAVVQHARGILLGTDVTKTIGRLRKAPDSQEREEKPTEDTTAPQYRARWAQKVAPVQIRRDLRDSARLSSSCFGQVKPEKSLPSRILGTTPARAKNVPHDTRDTDDSKKKPLTGSGDKCEPIVSSFRWQMSIRCDTQNS